MKRIIAAALISLFVLSLCSCGKQSAGSTNDTDNPAETSQLFTETLTVPSTDGTTTETVTESTTVETESEIVKAAPAPTTSTTAAPTTSTTAAPVVTRKTYGSVDFTAKDINGNTVSLSDYSGAKLIMVNMWEPWCGPCVREMPDLEKLYKNYKDKGLVIIGAFNDDESSAHDIVAQNGITYPVIIKPAEFSQFETQYVPTTFFIDGSGNVLSEESFIGSRSYGEWEQVVLSYMG